MYYFQLLVPKYEYSVTVALATDGGQLFFLSYHHHHPIETSLFFYQFYFVWNETLDDVVPTVSLLNQFRKYIGLTCMYVEVKLKDIAVGWSLHNSLEWYNEFMWGKNGRKKQ